MTTKEKVVFQDMKPDLSALTRNEKKVYGELVKAAKLLGDVYKKQKFYPRGVKADKLLKAAEANPMILDPYTTVKKDRKGLLTAVPFHEELETDLKKVHKALHGAAGVCDSRTLAECIRTQADALIGKVSYSAAEEAWVTLEGNSLDILVGPIDPYTDEVMVTKKGYQCSVSFATEFDADIEKMVEIVKSLQLSRPQGSKAGDRGPVRVRIDEAGVFSGTEGSYIAEARNQPDLLESDRTYGSKVALYPNAIEHKYDEALGRLGPKLLDESVLKQFPKEDMFNGITYMVLMHNIVESVIGCPGSEKRLDEYFIPVREANANMTGLRSCGLHVLKGLMPEEALLTAMMGYGVRAVEGWLNAGKSLTQQPFIKADAVAFNRAFEEEALVVAKGKIWVNFVKMFEVIEDLSNELMELLGTGTRTEAEKYFKENGDLEVFKRIEKLMK